MSDAANALTAMAATVLTGAAAGVIVFTGSAWLNPAAAALAFDWLGDGLGLSDALIPAWFLGHVALIVHHILPGIARS
ncbi:hypothetical protein [Aquamicrobium sp.]|uniref:hypothetical protein n=1 Tax=Aquamicrobium sp. TaxID=1872579 RepID=UPI002590AA83|nr:hypothetical protein [Aquamicrobium sp.]MCK9550326.1 hypothetical protein [Aquamicrobium sp.]